MPGRALTGSIFSFFSPCGIIIIVQIEGVIIGNRCRWRISQKSYDFSFSHIQDGIAGRGRATRFTFDFLFLSSSMSPGNWKTEGDEKGRRFEGDCRDLRDER